MRSTRRCKIAFERFVFVVLTLKFTDIAWRTESLHCFLGYKFFVPFVQRGRVILVYPRCPTIAVVFWRKRSTVIFDFFTKGCHCCFFNRAVFHFVDNVFIAVWISKSNLNSLGHLNVIIKLCTLCTNKYLKLKRKQWQSEKRYIYVFFFKFYLFIISLKGLFPKLIFNTCFRELANILKICEWMFVPKINKDITRHWRQN